MAITYRSDAQANVGSSPRTVNKPTGTAAGDLLILQVITGGTDVAPSSVPSGFVEIPSTAITTVPSIRLYIKTATGSEPADYTVTWASGSAHALELAAVTPDSGNALEVDAVETRENASGNRVWDGVTTSTTNTFLMCWGAMATNIGTTADASCTEQIDALGNAPRAYLMTQSIASAGATGTRTATGTSVQNNCVTVALKQVTATATVAAAAGALALSGQTVGVSSSGSAPVSIPIQPGTLSLSELAATLNPRPDVLIGRLIAHALYVDWDFDGNYSDESAYEISSAGSLRLSPPETAIWSPRGIVDRMTATLRNETRRFSPLNTAGALYSDIRDGKLYHAPMYQQVSLDGGVNFSRVFTGVIKIPQEAGSNTQSAAQVTLDCRSNDEKLLTRRISTTQEDFVFIKESGFTEAEVMASILISYAGLDLITDVDLDDGLFIIPWAWLDDESPIEACWALAAACGGRFYARHDGKLAYENAQHWLTSPHNASVATLDRSNCQLFRPYYNDTELYQSVTVEAQPRAVGVTDTLWEADEVTVVPPNTTGSDYVIVWAELDNPAWEIGGAGYSAASSGGTNLAGSVSLTQTNYAQRVELKFQNSHATLAAEIRHLSLSGKPVARTSGLELTATSSNAFWDDRNGRTRRLSGNRWIQTQAQLNFLTEFLRDRHEVPRLFWKIDGYRGDPTRRLGDRVTIDDSSVAADERDVFVTAIDWRYDRQTGFRQPALEAIDATELYAYSDAAIGYFVIGTNELGSADPQRGRVFY